MPEITRFFGFGTDVIFQPGKFPDQIRILLNTSLVSMRNIKRECADDHPAGDNDPE